MRLHVLELKAFGPFAGCERIDFDTLASGILLVNGPTGSGKSSLLDAITFALFGDVAGSRRHHRHELRSHHARPEAAPSVELVFSVGGPLEDPAHFAVGGPQATRPRHHHPAGERPAQSMA